ncbi:MAG: amidophosphoribosyltransferase [Oscillospiraceae bacterium]|nr:amidophosphoribosyltransferase [Oscillospiraceae bacterium]
MELHEECGVFGIWSPVTGDMAGAAYYALYALQHRGQESCGIVVNDDGVFSVHRDLGTVNDVFTQEVMERFPAGNMAVGHVRYGTTGGNNQANCQPIVVNHMKGKLALAHNGNLSNAYELRNQLEMNGAIFHGTSDSEIIAYIITQQRLKTPSIEEAVSRAMDYLEGAYSMVVMSSAKMIAARDPRGFHPLCYGKTPEGGYVIASESCALSAVGAKFERDILPGEILIIDGNGIHVDRSHCGIRPRSACIFEYIYFARPDSVIDGVSVHMARKCAGKLLARRHPVEADIVIGVPDSGLDAAVGYAEESGIPFGLGFNKNKYIGRTFISPGQGQRTNQVKIKLSPICDEVRGKRVVLIDDSIVRGTTSGQIVNLLREAGAKEIHMRISSPPFTNPCYYGTDVDSKENLIACHHSVPEIAEIIGADSLGYLDITDLTEMIGTDRYCHACFTGQYPTAVPTNTAKDRFEGKLSQRPPKKKKQ